jgi:hypothetical protein
MTFSATTYFIGVLLVLIQVLAALPWAALALGNLGGPAAGRRRLFAREMQPVFLGVLAALLVLPAVFPLLVQETRTLEAWGQVYAVVLQLQLLADAFIAVFVVLLGVWAKGGAIALASFREGVRQPMFWLLFAVAFLAMGASTVIPYFTFGEDHLMVREIGYDTIMLVAAVFGTLAASMSISEEIEGRTAVTLMSKPVSRRQFLIGKFLGIVLAAGVLFALLGVWFQAITPFKHWWDKLDAEPIPAWVVATLEQWALPGEPTDLLRGVGLWTNLALDITPGLILGFSQVMVLVAIAVSLATRVPMVVNLLTVVVIFYLAHLAPVLVSIGDQARQNNPGAAVSQILYFMSQLIDKSLPNLESFRIEPALLKDTPISAGLFTKYLASVSLYGLLYTAMVLLFGLILFEDRDLA